MSLQAIYQIAALILNHKEQQNRLSLEQQTQMKLQTVERDKTVDASSEVMKTPASKPQDKDKFADSSKSKQRSYVSLKGKDRCLYCMKPHSPCAIERVRSGAPDGPFSCRSCYSQSFSQRSPPIIFSNL